jgi:uncharacterized protein YwqG
MFTMPKLKYSLDAVGLQRVSQSILELSEPAIRFETTAEQEASMQVGTSKVGGFPDLPPGFPWPECQGRALDFLAQINLTELSGFEGSEQLPPTGILFFFFGMQGDPFHHPLEDASSWRVLFIDDPVSALEQRIPPGGDEFHCYDPCRVLFSQEWTIPAFESKLFDSLKLNEQEQSAYLEMLEEHEIGGIVNRILGHPAPIQGDVQLECQFASHGLDSRNLSIKHRILRMLLAGGYRNWQLLLQLDSDDNAGMNWVDSGRLYFLIRERDLRVHRLDRVWLILQFC